MLDAVCRGYKIILGGDFNSQLDVGIRGEKIAELAEACDLYVANSGGNGMEDNFWTFRSSLGHRRRLDFILVSSAIRLISSNSVRGLDLGSDHRAVEAHLGLPKTPKQRNGRSKNVRGWAPYNGGRDFRQELTAKLSSTRPTNLFEAEMILLDTSKRYGGSQSARQHQLDDAWSCPFLMELLSRRRANRNVIQRR